MKSLCIGIKHTEQNEAFLIKGVHDTPSCVTLELGSHSDPYTHSQKIVARLEGYDDNIKTSIGPILAISDSGARIAIAFWKRILVWAIDPQAFLDPFEDPSSDIETMDAAGGHAYIDACGQFLYQAYDIREDLVVLPPIELQNDIVVHKLAFSDEDILFGLTARGLVSWDMRLGCAGRQIMCFGSER